MKSHLIASQTICESLRLGLGLSTEEHWTLDVMDGGRLTTETQFDYLKLGQIGLWDREYINIIIRFDISK